MNRFEEGIRPESIDANQMPLPETQGNLSLSENEIRQRISNRPRQSTKANSARNALGRLISPVDKFTGLFTRKRANGVVPMLAANAQGIRRTTETSTNLNKQNRLRRVLTLLSGTHFDTFFPQRKGVSGSEISVVKHNDNTQIRELENLSENKNATFNPANKSHTIYDYGYALRNQNDPVKVANLYSDLLLMVVQLLFLQVSLIMDDILKPILKSAENSEKKMQIMNRIQRESNAATEQKNSSIAYNRRLKKIALTVWTTLNTGTLVNISIGTFGVGSVIAILVLLPSLAAANNAIAQYFNQKIKILLEKNALALRTVFTIMFDHRNTIDIFKAEGVDWPFEKGGSQMKILEEIAEMYPGPNAANREMVYDDNYFRLMSSFMMASYIPQQYTHKSSHVLMKNMETDEQRTRAALEACLQNGRGKQMLIDDLTRLIVASKPPSPVDAPKGGRRTLRRKSRRRQSRKS